MKDRRNVFVGLGLGLALAVAGTFGVAVGTYSLPDPTKLTVDAHTYQRVNQYARGVFVGTFQGAYSRIDIEVLRGANAGAAALVPSGTVDPQGPNTSANFAAQLRTCSTDECDFGGCIEDPNCQFQEWGGDVPLEAFTFDPTLSGASFKGNVLGCDFDVTWTGEGEVLPFLGHAESATFGESHAEARVDGGHAELSRVAPMSFDACFGSLDEANGYVSQGLRNFEQHAHFYEPQPEE